MNAYIFSAGKNIGQDYGKDEYQVDGPETQSEMFRHVDKLFKSFSASFMENASAALIRKDGRYFVTASGLLSRTAIDFRGRPLRAAAAWVLDDEATARAFFCSVLVNFHRRVEILTAGTPSSGDDFSENVMACISWDPESWDLNSKQGKKFGYDYDEQRLIKLSPDPANRKTEEEEKGEVKLPQTVAKYTENDLEKLRSAVSNCALPKEPKDLTIVVAHQCVDREAFEKKVYCGLALDFVEKQEAPRAPGESRSAICQKYRASMFLILFAAGLEPVLKITFRR